MTSTLLAQEEVQFTNDSDTAFWYHYKNAQVQQFKLGLLENDPSDYSFRFWSLGLVVKIAGSTNRNFGEVIRFVESSPSGKNAKVFIKR